MNTPLLASFLLMFYPLVCDSATSKEIKLEETLKSILDQNYALVLAGKGKDVLKFYTDDCVLINQGLPAIIGKSDLLKHFQGENLSAIKKMNVFIDNVYDKGDIVTLRYHLTSHGKDCSVLATVRAIIVWKKIKGKYLIHNLVSNVRENLCPSTS
ncbi:uncharacterized protein LOC124437207 isoform X2 [Xenia sp. Carnegie-2017]|uniref:uncharacterized protein LOC124437207 isoform X2 n=1 Tax=Xenia sp. Carnegie-2017 TaxID=2897299 RepID=UPI001F04BA39|nr:uncharacterized protein LOC124437207 isoform X2 [Xenia sp. Carnegie-2017]